MDVRSIVISGSLWNGRQRQIAVHVSGELSPPEMLSDRWRGHLKVQDSVAERIQPGDLLVLQQARGRELAIRVTSVAKAKVGFRCALPESPCDPQPAEPCT